ncbi:MAG: DUF1697 domain-containing protein [Bacteroidota bacterium]
MITYVALLRGINVSGQKKILMVDLRDLHEKLGFNNVRSYIQSGNIIFNYNGDISSSELSHLIEEAIARRFYFSVPVIIRTAHEIEQLIKTNPFKKEAKTDPNLVLFTLLKNAPQPNELSRFDDIDYSPDRFELHGNAIFLHCPNGYGKSKLTNNYFEKMLKTNATTRNWKTLTRILELT